MINVLLSNKGDSISIGLELPEGDIPDIITYKDKYYTYVDAIYDNDNIEVSLFKEANMLLVKE